MLEFVVVDDNVHINQQIQDIINDTLFVTEMEYKNKIFFDYTDDFFKLANSIHDDRVYILDIQTPHSSGITAIRTIRERDKKSKIIIISDYCDDHFPEIFKLKYILQTIKKEDAWNGRLKNIIKEEIIGENGIKITDEYKVEKINPKCIVRIYTSRKNKRTAIETDEKTIYTYKSIKQIKSLLSDDFMYCFRSQIINVKKIKHVDPINKIIQLDNGELIEKVSKPYFKEIKKRFKP